MPEIWLKYGSTEVVLDIKAENLLDLVTEAAEDLTEDQIRAKLGEISTNGSAQVAVLDSSQHVAKLSATLADSLQKRGIATSMNVPLDALNMYRSIFQDRGMQISKLPNDISQISNGTIFLSHTSFDPLFGYAGAPTHLLKHFGKDEMLEAYRARDGDMPRPGNVNNALSVAHKFAERFDGTSIETISGTRGFAGIIVDRPAKAHHDAISKLEALGKREVERVKASIISSGNGRATLSNALNSLWNCIDAVREDGSLTLLAECSDGFGSTALERFVEGKIDIDDARNLAEYVDGLENVLYLGEVGEKYELILISTLPDYYAKNRLGFKTFSKIKDALHHILNVYGPRQKVLVVSDASKVLLRPK